MIEIMDSGRLLPQNENDYPGCFGKIRDLLDEVCCKCVFKPYCIVKTKGVKEED